MVTAGDIVGACSSSEEQVRGMTAGNVRDFVAGVDVQVPVVGGRSVRYVNLDNAATTPPFLPILDCARGFFDWYASVHRGSGFKSQLATHVYEKCRRAVADFIGADLSCHAVIFTQNATHALNKLAARLAPRRDQVVITTLMEHHSNMLPWRKLGCGLEYAQVRRDDGTLNLADLQRKMNRAGTRLCAVTVTGASNVTGVLPPIRRIARMAHERGALFAVDATQLVPHRGLRMGDPQDPERVDFAVFSAHKMHAPFGSGVLVGPRAVFEEGWPDMSGGGTVNAVTMDDVFWAPPPEKEEAGTPNLFGAVALAWAIKAHVTMGMENLAEHGRELTRRALRQLSSIEGLTIYGPRDPDVREERIGIITLNAERVSHARLAAVLGHEWGIGVRNGCFCAQPYVRELLGVSDEQMRSVIGKLAAGDHSSVPGMVRVSLGTYNTAEEVDYFAQALRSILTHGPRADYVLDAVHQDYVPRVPIADLDDYAPI